MVTEFVHSEIQSPRRGKSASGDLHEIFEYSSNTTLIGSKVNAKVTQPWPFSSIVILILALTSLRFRFGTNWHMRASIAIDHLVAVWNPHASVGQLLYLYCIWPRRISPSTGR